MVREGTRSQTGNARPRVFQTVDTQPTIKRSKPIGAGRKSATTSTATPAAAPKKTTGGVTKKAPAKKAGGVAGKVRAVVGGCGARF